MRSEKDIADELLRQDTASEQEMSHLRNKILAREQVRLARMTSLVKLTWVLVVALWIGLLLGKPTYSFYPEVIQSLYVALKGLVGIAIVMTVFLWIRTRTLGMNQIHDRLAAIEEQLKKIAAKS